MYCKNCGKYLEEGTRFCDRCGQSVRKNANSEQAVRHQNIEELKEERLNRKKRLAEMEAREAMKNKRKQKRRKQNRRVAVFMIVVIILAIVSVVAAYNFMRSSSPITDGENVVSTQAPQSTQAAGSSAVGQTGGVNTSSPNPQSTAGAVANNGNYRVFEINNVECPYPSDFGKKTVSGNEKLSLVDSVGGGTMSISQEQSVSGTPAELMKDYADEIGVNPSYSLADKNGYAITIEKNNTIYHRKCIISGSTAIYYDFEYSSMSSSRARYEQCVAYIDSNMKTK